MVPVCEAALGAGDPPLLCIWPSSAVSDCISCIGRALTNGEAEILRRLRGTHDGTGV